MSDFEIKVHARKITSYLALRSSGTITPEAQEHCWLLKIISED